MACDGLSGGTVGAQSGAPPVLPARRRDRAGLFRLHEVTRLVLAIEELPLRSVPADDGEPALPGNRCDPVLLAFRPLWRDVEGHGAVGVVLQIVHRIERRIDL